MMRGVVVVVVVLLGARCGAVELSRRPGMVMTRRLLGSAGVLGTVGSSSVGAASAAASAAAGAGGPSVTLRDGTAFPVVSFGFQVYGDDEAARYTEMALAAGYRNFFASILAGNERGFARALRASSVPRSEVYVCGSVLSNRARGFDAAYKATKRGAEESLEKLGSPLEMLMLDYPGPDADSIRGQWQALEDLYSAGAVKTLAVSNFSPQQLDDVMLADAAAGWAAPAVLPAVNQLPYGVGYKPAANRRLLAENKKRNVHVQAWSPLRVTSPEALKACAAIGAAYGKTPQQVALKWILATGASFTTQTRSRAHCLQDMDLFDFQLTAKEVDTLSALQA